MKTAFELQTQDHMTWFEHCELVKDLTAQLAAKDAEIATLQPGYVAPEPPTVEKQFADAIAAVIESLPEEEKAIYADVAISFPAKVEPEEVKPVEDIAPIEKSEP
jgi:hypothetical protein